MIANTFVIFGLFGGLFLFPVYLQNIRAQSAFQAGLILLPQALASMVTVVAGGWLVDRFGARIVMIPGLLILGLASWQLSFITLNSPFWWLQLMLVLRGSRPVNRQSRSCPASCSARASCSPLKIPSR